jgi:hypothetical protein
MRCKNMSEQPEEERHKLTVILDKDDYDLIGTISMCEGKSMSQIVREAIRLYSALLILMKNPKKLLSQYINASMPKVDFCE